jgi:integrase
MNNSKPAVHLTSNEIHKILTKDVIESISNLCLDTIFDYLDTYYSLFNDARSIFKKVEFSHILIFAEHTRSKNTWFKRKAAITYFCRAWLNSFLLRQEDIKIKLLNPILSDSDRLKLKQSWRKEIDKSKFYLNILYNISNAWNLNSEERNQRASKRQHMRKMVWDWRELIIEKAMPKWKLQILVLAVTGCRPEELRKGVSFAFVGNLLICKIIGAKVKKGKILVKKTQGNGTSAMVLVEYQAGQESRELHFELNKNPLVDKLAIMLKGKNTIVKTANKSSLTSAISRVGKKLWPQRKHAITAYCFRHQLASDLKASGVEDDDISIALGHAVNTTKSRYGLRSMSKGGHLPTKVKGTTPIKQHKITFPRHRQRMRTHRMRKLRP